MMFLVVVSLVVSLLTLLVCAVLFRQLAIFVMGTARGIDDSGIPSGRYFPSVEATTVNGDKLQLPLPDRPQLIFFGSQSCSECRDIYPDVLALCEQFDVGLVNLIFAPNSASAREYASQMDLPAPVLLATPRLATRFDVSASPFAYAVDDAGVIRAKGLVNDYERLHGLIATVSALAGSTKE